jgi:hypothetical protein
MGEASNLFHNPAYGLSCFMTCGGGGSTRDFEITFIVVTISALASEKRPLDFSYFLPGDLTPLERFFPDRGALEELFSPLAT